MYTYIYEMVTSALQVHLIFPTGHGKFVIH